VEPRPAPELQVTDPDKYARMTSGPVLGGEASTVVTPVGSRNVSQPDLTGQRSESDKWSSANLERSACRGSLVIYATDRACGLAEAFRVEVRATSSAGFAPRRGPVIVRPRVFADPGHLPTDPLARVAPAMVKRLAATSALTCSRGASLPSGSS